MNHKPSFFYQYRFYLIIISLGLLVFGASLGNAFVWDDEEQVVNNGAVHSLASIPSLFLGSTFNTGGSGGSLSGMYYKPMMSLGFTILYTLFGPRAGWFHFFQVCLHIVNACLVGAIFTRLLGGKSKSFNYLGLFLSLAFLVHPLQVESAVYISALQDVLFLLFGLWALYRFLIFRLQTTSDYLWIGGLLLLSLLSKETGGLFLPLLLTYQLLRRQDKQQLLGLLNTLFGVVVIYSLMRFGLAQVYGAKEGLSPIMRVGLETRLLTAPKVIWYYLQNLVWPQHLAIAQHWVVQEINWSDFYFPLVMVSSFFLILLIILLIIKKYRKTDWPLIFWFFIWFCLGIGLHLHLIPLDMTVADRWFYFPMVGFLGMVGTGVTNFTKKRMTVIGVGVGTFVLILFSVRSVIRVLDWRDGLTLFSHDIAISQGAFDLENNLGVELFRAGRMEEAKPHFEKSIEVAPYWWSNYNNLGAYYNRKGELTKAEKLYRQAIGNSDYYLAYMNLAGVLIRQEKYEEAKQFLEREALPRFPRNPELIKFWQYVQILKNEGKGSE